MYPYLLVTAYLLLVIIASVSGFYGRKYFYNLGSAPVSPGILLAIAILMPALSLVPMGYFVAHVTLSTAQSFVLGAVVMVLSFVAPLLSIKEGAKEEVRQKNADSDQQTEAGSEQSNIASGVVDLHDQRKEEEMEVTPAIAQVLHGAGAKVVDYQEPLNTEDYWGYRLEYQGRTFHTLSRTKIQKWHE